MRTLFIRITICLLLLLSLTACGKKQAAEPAVEAPSAAEEQAAPESSVSLPETAEIPEEQPRAELTPEPSPYGEIAPSSSMTLQAEYESFPLGTDTIYVILKNLSSGEISTGEGCSLEQKTEDGWYTVPTADPLSWITVAYSIPAQGSRAFSCDLLMMGCDTEQEGTYRIVKNVEGETLAAEFTLSADALSNGGLTPLEDLP